MDDPRGSSGNNTFLLVCGWLEKYSSLEELRTPLAEAKATELKALEADLAANDNRDRNDQTLTAGGQPERGPPTTRHMLPGTLSIALLPHGARPCLTRVSPLRLLPPGPASRRSRRQPERPVPIASRAARL
ncbi:protein of unknown function (plasmid) [Rhodovastum atsumiense]|nr:protein of unknown function [Rhodovastum atsumiense]